MVRAVVDHGLSKTQAARQFNTSAKTVAKWVDRFKVEGVVGLRDRSSKPPSSPSQIPLATADAVERLRRERKTQEHIAGELGVSKASVSRILRRRGLSLLSSLEPQEPRPRYERATPGEIIHIDIKKLGRFNASPATAQAAGVLRAGSSLTSPSTITPAWHVPTSSRTRRRRVPWPSSWPPSPTSRASASRSSAS